MLASAVLQRRGVMRLMKMLAIVAMAACASACAGRAAAASAEAPEKRFALNASGTMKVAFVVSDRATLIDIAGPMQTFDQVQSPGTTGFQTYTVSETRQPIKAGTVTIVPDYTFADAPDPDIVVVGAQTGVSAPYMNYIRGMTARGKLMLPVCTGAAKFARAGILDGRP